MIAVTSGDLPGISNRDWDGVLGLLPTASSGADLLVDKLADQNIIPSHVFSVEYTDTLSGSQIIFGGYDTSIVSDFTTFTFTNLYSTVRW